MKLGREAAARQAELEAKKTWEKRIIRNIFWVIGCVAFAGLFFYVGKKAPTQEKKIEALRGMLHAYIEFRNEDAWWLEKSDLLDIGDAGLIMAKEREMREALLMYRDLNHETREIAKLVESMRLSVFHEGYTKGIITADALEQTLEARCQLVMVPRDQALKYPGLFPTSLFFREDWNSVLMLAINWPEKVLPAVAYHEFGHAALSQERNGGRQSEGEWIEEEVRMHELEAELMNQTTQGEFFRVIDGVITRAGKGGYKAALLSLGPEDLRGLDRALGATTSGGGVASVLGAQYVTILAFRAIDQQKIPNAMEEKTMAYKWITEHFRGI